MKINKIVYIILVMSFMAIHIGYTQQYILGQRPGNNGYSEGNNGSYRITNGQSFYEIYCAWMYKYHQASVLNLQNGIKSINCDSKQLGVTPINGILMLNSTDAVIPARMGSIGIIRIYNSKIWSADSVRMSKTSRDMVKAPYSWMGMGWDLHFGRKYQLIGNDSGWVYEKADGECLYFQISHNGSGNEFIATDGSFDKMIGDTIKTSSGELLIFSSSSTTMYPSYDTASPEPNYIYMYGLNKYVDKNGNVTSFYYNSNKIEIYGSSLVGEIYGLDSIISSAYQKIRFYYYQHITHDRSYVLLDSIKYVGCYGDNLKIMYHYKYDSTTTSPFGQEFTSEMTDPYNSWGPSSLDRPVYLLTSVIYPNSESIYYGYDSYYELNNIQMKEGSSADYVYTTDTFYIPRTGYYGMGETRDYPWWHYTRGVSKSIVKDPFSSADTTKYERFRRSVGSWHVKAMSNADSVCIKNPTGDYQVSIYRASRKDYDGQGDGKVFWETKSGIIDTTVSFDKNHQMINMMIGGDSAFIKITNENISVAYQSWIKDSRKKYGTRFYNYDNYGNARLIHEYGDSSITTDDRWIHRSFVNVSAPTCSLQLSFYGNKSTYYAKVNYTSPTGFDSMLFVRHWWGGSATCDSVNKIYYNPVHYNGYETFRLKPIPVTNDTLVVCSCWVYYSTKTMNVLSGTINLSPADPVIRGGILVDTDQADYLTKNLIHLISEEWISADSVGDTLLSKTKCFYDDTISIIKSYPSDSIKLG